MCSSDLAATALTAQPLRTLVGAPLPDVLREGAGPTRDVVRVRRPDGSVQSWGVAETPVFLTSTFVFRTAQDGKDFFDYTSGRKPLPPGTDTDVK